MPELETAGAGRKAKWAFEGRVALVTGGARGIGRTIATAFGMAGAQIAICDINAESSRNTVSELRLQGIAAESFQVDLSRQGEPQRMVTEVAKRFGRLDVLVNNARAGKRLGLMEDCEENWDLTMSVGLRAAQFAARQAIPIMEAGGGGSIVNISSVAAQLVSLESAGYHAAKAGVMQLTRYLAVNAGARGVRVNSILPGFIVQDEHRERYLSADNADYRARAENCHPLARVGFAADVAEATLFLCSDSAGFITGQSITVDGGFTIQDPWSVMSKPCPPGETS